MGIIYPPTEPYTVLVMLPDRNEDGSLATYLAWVMERGEVAACFAAQRAAWRDTASTDLTQAQPDKARLNTYEVLLCIRGHHDDLTPEIFR